MLTPSSVALAGCLLLFEAAFAAVFSAAGAVADAAGSFEVECFSDSSYN